MSSLHSCQPPVGSTARPVTGSDKELVAAFKRGDNWAVEQVYRAVAPIIVSFIAQNGGRDDPLIQDILQDALFKAWKASAHIKATDSRQLCQYVITAAKNHWVSNRRSARQRWMQPSGAAAEYALDAAVSPTPTPEAEASKGELLAMVENDPKAAAILQPLWEGKTREEVARMLGISRRTLSRRLDEVYETFKRRKIEGPKR